MAVQHYHVIITRNRLQLYAKEIRLVYNERRFNERYHDTIVLQIIVKSHCNDAPAAYLWGERDLALLRNFGKFF